MMGPHDWADLMDFSQTGLSYDCVSGQDLLNPLSVSDTDTGPAAQLPSTPHENGSSDLPKDTTNQLANMMTSLEAISQKLSSVDLQHVSKCNVQQWADNFHKTIHLSNSLELILSHCQDLSILYSTVSNTALNSNSGAKTCVIHDCIHELQAHQPGRRLPFSLLNLLLTCHLQLLHVLGILIGHSQTCCLIVTTLPEGEEPHFDIPKVRIGSFVAPSGTATSLFTTMLYQLLRDLQGKIKGFSASVAAMEEHGSSPSEVRVLCLQSDIIKDRTTRILEELQMIKTEMIKRGH
jgi:hypothetical protein